MANLDDLTSNIHMLIEQLAQVQGENKKRKQDNKELTFQLEQVHNENEMLKQEIEATYEKLKMMEMQFMSVSVSVSASASASASASMSMPISEPVYERDYAMKCGRIRPFDAVEDSNEDRERKKGGKKTSL
jgi:hypothetical protein